MLRTSFDAAQRMWHGPKVTPLYHPNVNIAAVLLAALRYRPEHLAQICDSDGGSRLTNGELRQLAVRIALNLQRVERIRHGSMCSMVVRNHRLVAPLVIGCMALAAPINSLDPDFAVAEMAHMFGLTRPQVVFADAQCVERVRQALGEVGDGAAAAETPVYTVDERVEGCGWLGDLCAAVGDAVEMVFLPTDVGDGTRHPAAIVCSSGTTGMSKGVKVSHALLLQKMAAASIPSDDIHFSFSSLYWISGLQSLVFSHIFGVTRIVTATAFTPAYMLDVCRRYAVTSATSAPSHIAQLLQLPDGERTAAALRTVRTYICGGDAIPLELEQRFNAALPRPMLMTYGLSETAGLLSLSVAAGGKLAAGSGQLLADYQVRLRRLLDSDGDSDDADADANDAFCNGPDQRGEIWLRVDGLPLLGYWADERATREAIDADGWLHTGDVGHFDAAGNLHVVDRIKDMLKYMNTQIVPAELEACVLRACGDRVAEVCVVGVPDGRGSDLVAAVVVRRSGGATTAAAAAEVERAVEEAFSDAKRLRGGVWFVERLPLTPSGKVVRRRVREWVERWLQAEREQQNERFLNC